MAESYWGTFKLRGDYFTFVDGVKHAPDCFGGSKTSPVKNSVFPVTFGSAGAPYRDPQHFPGTLDEIRIYGRGLSDVEILQLFQLGR